MANKNLGVTWKIDFYCIKSPIHCAVSISNFSPSPVHAFVFYETHITFIRYIVIMVLFINYYYYQLNFIISIMEGEKVCPLWGASLSSVSGLHGISWAVSSTDEETLLRFHCWKMSLHNLLILYNWNSGSLDHNITSNITPRPQKPLFSCLHLWSQLPQISR